jgi:Zn-finger nucleic acid-binding protein
VAELACPVCKPPRLLHPVEPGLAPALLQCGVCAGIWAHADSAQDARARYGQRHRIMLQHVRANACRKCGNRLAPALERCGACGGGQAIGCLTCAKPMARVRVRTCVVDLCRPCRSSWLDAGELALLARWAEDPAFSLAPTGQRRERSSTSGDILFDPFPTTGLDGAGEALSHLPAVAEVAGEGAIGVVEVAGSVVVKVAEGAAEIAVEGIGALLAGLFDGL